VTLALKLGYQVETAQEGIEALSWKIGLVLLVLGAMHFFNLLVFTRIRRHGHFRPTVAYAGTEGFRGFNDSVGDPVEE
jgi:hypothetical protein